MNALNVLCAQLTSDLFAIAKFLFTFLNIDGYNFLNDILSLNGCSGLTRYGILSDIIQLPQGTAVVVTVFPYIAASYTTKANTSPRGGER